MVSVFAKEFETEGVKGARPDFGTSVRINSRHALSDFVCGFVGEGERQDGRRILSEQPTAIAFVPYFARYAYEVYVAPTITHASIATLSDAERRDLALVLRDVVIRFDNLWKMPFHYVMALHQAPTDQALADSLFADSLVAQIVVRLAAIGEPAPARAQLTWWRAMAARSSCW